jgi:probable HAF family extracellular repeat protein
MLALCGLIVGTARADGFFFGLGELPGGYLYFSGAQAVSDDGSVVTGQSNGEDGTQPFRWTAEDGMVGLGLVGTAYAVSANGETLAGYASFGSGGSRAYRWTESEGMVNLGLLPGGSIRSMAFGISTDGSVIVGVSDTETAFSQAFRWTQEQGMVALPDLPEGLERSTAYSISADGTVIVGDASSAAGTEACRWTADGVQGLGVLPGGEYSSKARAVSADGSVIVGSSQSAFTDPDSCEMFRWTEDGGMVGLGDLSGGEFQSYAYDVSADGSVIVGVGYGADGSEAVVWDVEHGMCSLNDVLPACGIDLGGWVLREAWGVTPDGLTIVGYGFNPNGDTEAWLAHIPEPASLTLLMLGLAAALRRRGQSV